MKRSRKQARVSWPPGPKLCQVKMFRAEDCPAKIVCQPQRVSHLKQSTTGKPRVPDLPPGFEGNHYATTDKPMNVKNIPRIKWKRPPPKIILNDSWMLGGGGDSTERRTENLRISQVMEAIYPHRSAIPSRPSVSPAVEAECCDDTKTPTIRLTPIEDESESPDESSQSLAEPGFNPLKEETKLPSPTEEPVSGLAPELSLAASAALTALMKTKEHGSMIDRDLLVKILSDPKMVKNLIGDKTGKPSETKTQPTIETPLPPQHATALPKPQPPLITPREQSFATPVPFTNPNQQRASPPKPGYRIVPPPLNPINGNRSNMPCVNVARPPARIPTSSMPMNLNFQRPQHAFSQPKVIANPHPQLNMNSIQAPIGFRSRPQTGFDTYPMNFNRVDAIERPRPVVMQQQQQPMRKSVDYFKNLIKEHGTDNHETNQYHSQTGIFNAHDRFRHGFEGDGPMAKRMKFERYGRNGL